MERKQQLGACLKKHFVLMATLDLKPLSSLRDNISSLKKHIFSYF